MTERIGYIANVSLQLSTDYTHILYADLYGDVFWEDRSVSELPAIRTISGNAENRILREPNVYYAITAAKTFEDDYYDQVHSLPNIINFGNVSQETSVSTYIWNAFRVTNTLNSVLLSGDDNVNLNLVAPTTFYANEYKLTEATTNEKGSAVIAAQYNLLFDYGYAYFEMTGLRATMFSFQPIENVVETLSWQTDIVTSISGKEQRVRIRPGGPVQTINYKYHVKDFDRYKAHFLTSSQFPYFWAIPIWWEGSWLHSSMPAGTYEIEIDTTQSDFRDESSIVLFERPDLFEVCQIASIETSPVNKIVLYKPTLNSYSNVYVLPMRIGIAMKNITRDIYANPAKLNRFEYTFKSNENINLTGTIDFPVYRNLYVLNKQPLRESSLKESYSNAFDVLETPTGVSLPIKTWDKTKISRPHSFRIKTSDFWPFRLFLHDCAGQLKPFFVPTWENTLEVLVQIVNGATAVSINRIGYYEYGLNSIYTYLYLRTKDGAVHYKKIIGVSISLDQQKDVLALADPFVLASTINLNDIDLVCFMYVGRLASDTLEFSHNAYGYTDVTLPVIGIDYDA